MSDIRDLHPYGVFLSQLEAAYGLHLAASETYTNSGTLKVDGLSSEQLAQRNAILNIAAGIIIAKRNNKLDEFCRAWLSHRGLLK